jgi:hypothetical protein
MGTRRWDPPVDNWRVAPCLVALVHSANGARSNPDEALGPESSPQPAPAPSTPLPTKLPARREVEDEHLRGQVIGYPRRLSIHAEGHHVEAPGVHPIEPHVQPWARRSAGGDRRVEAAGASEGVQLGTMPPARDRDDAPQPGEWRRVESRRPPRSAAARGVRRPGPERAASCDRATARGGRGGRSRRGWPAVRRRPWPPTPPAGASCSGRRGGAAR